MASGVDHSVFFGVVWLHIWLHIAVREDDRRAKYMDAHSTVETAWGWEGAKSTGAVPVFTLNPRG